MQIILLYHKFLILTILEKFENISHCQMLMLFWGIIVKNSISYQTNKNSFQSIEAENINCLSLQVSFYSAPYRWRISWKVARSLCSFQSRANKCLEIRIMIHYLCYAVWWCIFWSPPAFEMNNPVLLKQGNKQLPRIAVASMQPYVQDPVVLTQWAVCPMQLMRHLGCEYQQSHE